MGTSRYWMVAIASGVALTVAACETAPDTTVTEPSPAASPVPVAVAPATAPATQPLDGPAGQGQATPPPAPVGSVPPELIRSTNPSNRVSEIRRSRPDPFVIVPTTPSIVRTPQPPEVAAAPPQPTTPLIPRRPVPVPGQQQPTGNGQLAPIPSLVPSRPVVPPPPPTDLARAVRVYGVVQIGRIPHAIVQAPNEPSSRYVRVGQVLSNGEVLVKRIDMIAAEPVVVLEQNGVEVATAVGEGGVPAANQPGAAPAAQPAAPPAPPTASLPAPPAIATRPI